METMDLLIFHRLLILLGFLPMELLAAPELQRIGRHLGVVLRIKVVGWELPLKVRVGA